MLPFIPPLGEGGEPASSLQDIKFFFFQVGDQGGSGWVRTASRGGGYEFQRKPYPEWKRRCIFSDGKELYNVQGFVPSTLVIEENASPPRLQIALLTPKV